MTAMSRLTMFYREVGERAGDVLAAIDRALEIVEQRLLADELARLDAGVVEEARGLLPEDHVAVLFEAPHLPRHVDELLVAVLAQGRQHRREQRRRLDQDRGQLP